MNKISITIDGQSVEAIEGEYILDVARANNIFIPAICYLTRCSPTLACRLCLIDVDGKQAYACNAKAKAGQTVLTVTENILKERRAIMEVYDINHPLECGVCDQSGECELQNYTLEIGVDSQTYSIKDTHKVAKDWGLIHYDPSLCIVCERCITVCKDMIGDSALKTMPRGGVELDASLKETMPKDAYSMWNKLNKSIIGLSSGGDKLDCTSCGECIAVCPVGALVSSDFQYKSNAWELKSIPASCSHCSSACHLYYDVKHTSIDNIDKKIYRVKNEFHYSTLCGAGRFGFDYENRVASKDDNLNQAVDAFRNADTIKFDSFITNEEALILQKLKEKFGYKLINHEALRFKNFLNSYSKTSGNSLYSGDLKSIHSSNFIVSLGSMITTDNPRVRYAINNSLTVNKGALLYFHPIKNSLVEGMSKNIATIYHTPNSEEAVLYLLLELFAKKESLPKEINSYLDSLKYTKVKKVVENIREKVITKTVDENGVEKEVESFVPKKIEKDVEVSYSKLYDMLNLKDSFLDDLEKLLAKKDSFALVVGEDLITHKNSANLAKLVGILERCSNFKVLIIPPKTNSLGVSLICDLDSKGGKYSIGYNVDADYKLSSLGDGDFNIPALNQQEGTFVNIDKRVVPTNVALPHSGYTLNDIAKALDIDREFTISYTKELPLAKGFREVEFDMLQNSFDNSQNENRGYLLENFKTNIDDSLENFEITDLKGVILYSCNPILQFNEFTYNSSQLKEVLSLEASEEFLTKNSLSEGDLCEIKIEQNSITLPIRLNSKIGGNIALLPNYHSKVVNLIDGYRFTTAIIKKV